MNVPAAKKKILFISNIPAPYRMDFFELLGQTCDLTVVYEARRAKGIRFNWNDAEAHSFRTVFLSDGEIDETHVDRRILRYIKRGLFDQVVATSYGYYTETAALFKLRLLGIPYDLELDGGVVRAGENRIKALLKRCIIRGARRLFSTGEATDELFTHYGAWPEQLVRYPFTSLHRSALLPAVPTEAEKQRLRAALSIPYRQVVLTVGQFIHRKGFDVLLSVCDRFDENVGVYIVGGEPTEEYRMLVEQRKLTRVHFLPFMDTDALAQWFTAADVFVLPTREDMWGLVVNEAMAHALPVVTTERCNAGRELIKNGVNGYLVPAEDGGALFDRANAILSDDALRRRMAQASLDRIQSYTLEEMVRVHLAAFDA